MSDIVIEPSARERFSASDLNQIELAMGTNLPEDYKAFVSKMGPVSFGEDGVTFDVEWRRVDKKAMALGEDEDFEDDFMLLVLSDVDDVREHIDWLHAISGNYDPMVPRDFFPFSTGASREYFLMSLAKEDYGAVYLYFPSDDPWGTSENNYLGYIASSFTDFIENKIRPYE